MKILIDTAPLLWAASNSPDLSKTALSILEEANHTLFFSAVTAWEIAIKFLLGKLVLHQDLQALLDNSVVQLSLTHLPITYLHTLKTASLPFHHKDPFDRLLVAQAQIEGMTILTSDPDIRKYDVEVIW